MIAADAGRLAWMYSAAVWAAPAGMRPSRNMSGPTEIMLVASATSVGSTLPENSASSRCLASDALQVPAGARPQKTVVRTDRVGS